MSKQPEREIDDRLADWVDGRLSERERERFVAELRVNAQLRLDLAEYERTVAAVRAALRAPTQPVDLTARVMGALAAQATRGTSGGSLSRRRPLYWSLAAAAALLVLAVAIDRWPTAASPLDSGTVDRVASADTTTAHDDAAALRKAQEKPGEVVATEEERKVREFGALAEAPAAPAPAPAAIAPGAPDGGVRGGAEGPGAAAVAGAKDPAPVQKPVPEGNPVNDPTKPAGDVSALQGQLSTVPETSRREDLREVGAAVGEKAKEDLGRAKLESSRAPPALRDGEARAEVPKGDTYSLGFVSGARGANVAQHLPMVSLTRYRSAQAPATGGPGAAPSKSAPSSSDFFASAARNPSVPAELEAFLASQVAQPSGYFKNLGEAVDEPRASVAGVRYGNLSLVPLPAEASDAWREQDKDAERRAAGARTAEKRGKQQEGAPAPVADPKAPTESHWLVEGSKAEVEELVRNLADYARRSGLDFANGELTADSPVLRGRRAAPGGEGKTAPAAPGPPTPREPARPAGPPTGAEAPRADQEPMRIVLRFRVLPPK